MRLPPDVAYAVFDVLDADQSQLESCDTGRLLAVQPAAHLLLDGSVEACPKLLVRLAVCSFVAGERLRTADNAPEPPIYDSPIEAFRIRPIAVVWTSHARVSRFSMARPEAVSE